MQQQGMHSTHDLQIGWYLYAVFKQQKENDKAVEAYQYIEMQIFDRHLASPFMLRYP